MLDARMRFRATVDHSHLVVVGGPYVVDEQSTQPLQSDHAGIVVTMPCTSGEKGQDLLDELVGPLLGEEWPVSSRTTNIDPLIPWICSPSDT